MIAWLNGRVHEVGPDHVVLDVRGVGYHVAMAARDLAAMVEGDEAELVIHTVVREDALLLFGFSSRASRDLFLLLVSVSGVGPKGAMALLSELSPAEIGRAIHDEQMPVLTRAKGIGKRLAELLIVRLRDRLPPELLREEADGKKRETWTDEVRAAHSGLCNMGFKPTLAATALDVALADGVSPQVGPLVRAALAALRRGTPRRRP